VNHIAKRPKKPIVLRDADPADIIVAMRETWSIHTDTALILLDLDREKIQILASTLGTGKVLENLAAFLATGGRDFADYLEGMAEVCALTNEGLLC
jgi:hypothetical protein